jgi:hypothetical protein
MPSLLIRLIQPSLSAAVLTVILTGCAGSTPSDVAEGVRSGAQPAAAAHTTLFVSGVYRGHIGEHQVEMTLNLDADSPDSVHGWYLIEGDPSHAKVLLAGELEDEALSMEESKNGVDVSGHFNAVLAAGEFSGEWSDINGEQVQPIEFRHIAKARLPS